jgi:hypothetical protein
MIVIIQQVKYLLDSKFDNLGKTVGIKYSHIGKNLAVQFHTSFIQTSHQLTVTRAILLCSGTDAGYPKSAEITLFISPVTVSVTKGSIDSFSGCFV